MHAALIALLLGLPAAVPTPPEVARYGFDGERPWADSSGNGHHLTPFGGNQGRPRRVPHGAGKAVQFPAPCSREPCRRLILRVLSRAGLNPGASPFSYGATVRLAARDTSDGQNVLQKGFAAEGSQYKLQIDGRAGQPSCVLVGEAARTIHLAISDIGVADGRWHRVECRREQHALTVLVDGTARTRTPVPPALRIDNNESLNIGGKSAFAHNDQFHGAVDDVWIRKP
ncbi:LamG-like jellyroll fold domain-containing protein [Actinoplanes utahensis]|uniref:LamG-like jellyroll fold domain-containing protein n=1 Tax=Actinoplanes utahensis TaxID=1869 RepID=UPI00068D7D0D|nr:LamG-like jellyroll fold domain-containing protein [Actinoplanes utahensis]GIF30148.1 hypothetical protein Aut01nite_31340 [Actinoplanes utahensis]